MKTYDFAVIGGGPSGSIFTWLASKKSSVVLINDDKTKKPCGGLIAPDAQKMLARFELTMPGSVLVDPQIFAVKTIDTNISTQRYYRRMYINVDRAAFDSWLLSLCNKADILNGRCIKIEHQQGIYKITCNANGGKSIVYAKNIVGADGASSKVRTQFFGKLQTQCYVAIQQHYNATGKNNPFYSCIFDKTVTDCCSWSLYKNEEFIFGGAYKKEHCIESFERQKELLKGCGFCFDDLLKTESCMVLRPKSLKSFCCGKETVYLIGEAAGFISPSSLEGISSAFKSAVALYESIFYSKKPVIKAYRKKTFMLKQKLCLKRIKCLFMYNPFLRMLVLKSKFTAIKLIY